MLTDVDIGVRSISSRSGEGLCVTAITITLAMPGPGFGTELRTLFDIDPGDFFDIDPGDFTNMANRLASVYTQ